MCAALQVGQYVCCTPGALPDFSPKPYANGTCYTHTVQSGDTCGAIAASYQMKATVIEVCPRWHAEMYVVNCVDSVIES